MFRNQKIKEENEKNKQKKDWNAIFQEINNKEQEDNNGLQVDDEIFTNQQNDDVNNIIKNKMDEYFNEHAAELQVYLDAGDTEEFIKVWSHIVEEATLDAGKIMDEKTRVKYKGHGYVQMEKKRIPVSGVFNKNTNNVEPKTKDSNLERLKKQARRITAIQEMKSALLSKKDKKPKWHAEMIKQIKQSISKFIKDTDKGNLKECEVLNKLYESKNNATKQALEAKKARWDFDQMINCIEKK